VHLITLGRLALVNASGQDEVGARHRRKLALLAFLSLADGPVSRDRLVELFWGDERDPRAARHSLSNALSFLRGALERDAITAHRSDVTLVPGAVHVDAVELLSAARARNVARVVALYRGPFLDASSAGGSAELEAWVRETRRTIDQAVAYAAEVRCAATAAAGDWPACARTARTWLRADPRSGDAALALVNALRGPGTSDDRLAALAAYDELTAGLAELRMEPDPRVVEIVARLQARVAAERAIEPMAVHHSAVPTLPAASGSLQSSNPDSLTAASGPSAGGDVARGHADRGVVAASLSTAILRWRRPHAAVAGMIAAGILAAAGLSARSWLSAQSLPARPVIAVTDVQDASGDTSTAWLDRGLAQMLAADLARNSTVEVIEQGRVDEVRARAELPAALSEEAAADLARRLGATVVVRANLTHADSQYVLHVVERRVSGGALVTTFNVAARDAISLADRATLRLLAAATPSDTATRAGFADVQTSSAEAYQHFVRSEQAGAAGRDAAGVRELDAAIALDSGFGTAVLARLTRAVADGDSVTADRLRRVLPRARFTAWDRLVQATDSALHNGENARAEQMARTLTARYPHDPRAYAELAAIYGSLGRFEQADSVIQRELALDSLGNEAGRGPCVPCSAYMGLIGLRAFDGQFGRAEQTARRAIALQPDLPAPWAALGDVLGYEGRIDAAVEAHQRAIVLSGNEPVYSGQLLRTLIIGRRFEDADSLVRAWSKPGASAALRREAADGRALLERERGQLRASMRTLAADSSDAAAVYERMDALSRLGSYTAAAALFRRAEAVLDPEGWPAHQRDVRAAPAGDAARSFTWSRALLAEAIAGAGDTTRLRVLADSIHELAARSYYARDWRLYHHVLGRIAMQGKRYAEAEREFAATQWGYAGWTANLAWLARAQLAQHRPKDAVATLRRAYGGPLDAMGRYEPRSDVDYLMAVSFQAAGQTDSAAVYRGYLGRAWRQADPEIRRQLAALR